MRNNKGITMISLIITIIILLILAGVTIAFLTGENGILNKASTAAETTKKANAKERLKVELMAIQTEDLVDGKEANLDSLYANKEQLSEKGIEIAESGTPRNVTLDGYTFKVKNDLTIEGDGTGTSAGDSSSSGSGSSGDTIIGDDDVTSLLTSTGVNIDLNDIFTSETILDEFLANTSSIDYILENKNKYGDYILNNTNTMKRFASNEYAMNKMIDDTNWRNAILSNNTAIAGLDASNPTTVPTMTSNTTPSGEAFASSFYSGYPAWNAFDNVLSTYWGVGQGLSYENQYVGYSFDTPIWLYKTVAFVSNGKQDTDYVIEASNDKSNWVILKDGLHQKGSKETIISNSSNSQKYQHYRLRLLSTVAQSGSENTIIPYIQFYGK